MTIKEKIMQYFIIAIGAAFLAALAFSKSIEGTNSYFITLHGIGILLVTLATVKYGFPDIKLVSPRPQIYKRIPISAFLLMVPLAATKYLSTVSFGSVFLTVIISICAGTSAYLLFGTESSTKKEEQAFTLKDYWENTKEIHISRIENAKGWSKLIFIFFFGLLLRVWVLGTPKVPPGYDIPVYLFLAEEGLHASILQLVNTGFTLTGDVYLDTWNFAILWLGLAAKALELAGLDTIFIAKLIMPLISSLSIIMVYFLTLELTSNKNAALWASFFFAVIPAELLFNDLYKELFGEFWLLVALYFAVKLSKKRSYTTVALLLISCFFMWKSAITVVAKAFMFLSSYIFYLAISKRIYRADVVICGALVIISLIIFNFTGGGSFGLSLTPVQVHDSGAYTRLAFPIIAITNMTAFLLSIYYLFEKLIADEQNNDAVPFLYVIFSTLLVYSLLISGLMGYRIFPSSTMLNNFRFALYIDIPLAILSGIMLNRILSTINGKKAAPILAAIIILATAADFVIALHPETTIHESRLNQYVDEDVYEMLVSTPFHEYDRVFVAGNFTWSETNENYALGNWIKYITYSESGKNPIFIESKDQYFTNSDSHDLLLIHQNQSIEVLSYN